MAVCMDGCRILPTSLVTLTLKSSNENGRMDANKLHFLTCMKKPAKRALLMLTMLLREPKAGTEMGSSILFRVSVSSLRIPSAINKALWSR